MKKIDFITAILFLIIVSYTFSITSNSEVFGQTSSSSGSTTSSSSSSTTSSSGGSTTSSSSGIVESSSSSTSSSGGSTTSSSSGIVESSSSSTSTSSGVIESSSGSTESSSGSEGNSSSGETESSSGSGISSSSTSSTGGPVTLSEEFTGIWRAEVERTVTVNGTTISKGSRIITTKLCLDNGILKGFVQQPGVLTRGVITSQNVISANEVELQLQDISGKTSSIHFTLADGKLNGTFSNGIVFSAIKQNTINPKRVCIDLGILPTSSSGNSSSTSSTGGTPAGTVSTNFNGIWEAKLDREVQVNGVTIKQSSRKITLRLCVSNGSLTGIITHPSFITRGVITSFDVISENEVTANFTDIKGRTGSVQLTLNGSELTGKFSNDVVFSAINRLTKNPGRACIGLGALPNSNPPANQ